MDPEEIRYEHEIRPDIDYYPFTDKQLYKLETRLLIGLLLWTVFLVFKMHYIPRRTDEIAIELLDIINLDLGPAYMIDYLQSFWSFLHPIAQKLLGSYYGPK